jgi:hypothetical protein
MCVNRVGERGARVIMRRALLIGTPFFNYHRSIIASFRDHGYDVDYYNDRPGENPFIKGAIRLRPNLVNGVVGGYLRNILDETRGRRYDLILVINGKVLTPAFVGELRGQHPESEAVLYLWDSIQLYPHVLTFSGLFDRRYTFDAEDAGGHNEFTLLPLFYTHDYRDVGARGRRQHDYDLVNVCTAHENRYSLMRTLIPSLRQADLRVYSYLYLHPLQFAYCRVRSDSFAGSSPREFAFRPLPVTAYVDVLSRSRAVLDVNHESQSGLTMRTIETLGARRKLITTNRDVEHYQFYDPSRVLLVDPRSPDVLAIKDFVNGSQDALDPSIYRMYDIDTWMDELITGEGRGLEQILRQ